MTNRQPPSDDDPAQLPVEPEFPAQDLPSEPLADEGKPGSEKDATSFVKDRP